MGKCKVLAVAVIGLTVVGCGLTRQCIAAKCFRLCLFRVITRRRQHIRIRSASPQLPDLCNAYRHFRVVPKGD